MLEHELPECCERGHWIIRDPIKRLREVRRRGFSSLARCATCSICGRVIYFDPGKPDEEFQKRKQARRQKRNGGERPQQQQQRENGGREGEE